MFTLGYDPVLVCSVVVEGRSAGCRHATELAGVLRCRCGWPVGGGGGYVHEERVSGCVLDELHRLLSDDVSEVVQRVVIAMGLRHSLVGDRVVVVLTGGGGRE